MDKHYPQIGSETLTLRWGDMDAVGHLNKQVLPMIAVS